MSNDIIRNSVAGHFPAWYGTRVVDIVDWLCCHSSAFLFVIKLRCAPMHHWAWATEWAPFYSFSRTSRRIPFYQIMKTCHLIVICLRKAVVCEYAHLANEQCKQIDKRHVICLRCLVHRTTSNPTKDCRK